MKRDRVQNLDLDPARELSIPSAGGLLVTDEHGGDRDRGARAAALTIVGGRITE